MVWRITVSSSGRAAAGCAHFRAPLSNHVGLQMTTNLNDPEFDETITLREAYRVMEAFVGAFLARGDGAVSELLHFHIGSSPEGLTMDPASPEDFLAALAAVRASRE